MKTIYMQPFRKNTSFLSESAQNEVLKTFPPIELSYEKMVHNKVLQENGVVFSAIPQGKKFFVYIPSSSSPSSSSSSTFLLEIAENKQIRSIQKSSLHLPLAGNAVFYGTLFYSHGKSCFSIEDVHYYENKHVGRMSFLNKLNIFADFFAKYNETQNQDIFFRLPILSTHLQGIQERIQSLPYKVHHIDSYGKDGKKYMIPIPISTSPSPSPSDIQINTNTNANTNTNTKININTSKERIFHVKPDSQNDIYHLYVYDESQKKEVFFDIAYIPSYTCSVMMNKIFRKIKENANLDLLEESDDEEEFESEDPHKFVDLDKSYNMLCVYNHKFKKWVPVRIANTNKR